MSWCRLSIGKPSARAGQREKITQPTSFENNNRKYVLAMILRTYGRAQLIEIPFLLPPSFLLTKV